MRVIKLIRASAVGRYLLAAGACALIVLLTWPLRDVLDPANTVMLLLLAVALIAAGLGRREAVLASFVSVGLFDFFFVQPHLSFAVGDVQYLLTFVVMLTVSLLIGQLTNRLQASADEARLREARAQALYALARSLAGAMTVEQVLEHSTGFLEGHAAATARFFLPDAGGLLQPVPPAPGPGIGEATAMAAVFHSCSGSAAGGVGGFGETGLLLPLNGASHCRGVMSVKPLAGAGGLDALQPLLEAVASLVAIAVERLHFVAAVQASQLEAETERLRSSILSSISHDIRTPLTVLFGQADALAQADGRLAGDEREAALAIRDQAGRLHEMVDKLLDMARLQAGAVRLRKEWQAMDEILGAAMVLLGEALRAHPVVVTQAPALPLVAVDAVLVERVFCNLLENAAKYAPPSSPIAVTLATEAGMLVVTVSDEGSGFPASSLDRVFDLFERGLHVSTAPGVGVGLAICRAIVEAHGGWIAASNRQQGGACVRFALPCDEPPTIEPEAAGVAGVAS